MSTKILSIFGTRPEAIKMAPVVAALQNAAGIESVVCVTAQHREMLNQVLELFGIVPHHDLQLMRPNQTLSDLTSRCLTGLDAVLALESPDWVLVQGDTTTAMAGALAAFYRKVKVGHVEAGLRSNDKYQPFPEEINRKIVTQIADLNFAPTEVSRDNLIREGIASGQIRVTGNTVIDALQQAASMDFNWDSSALSGIAEDQDTLLVTAHRRENFGEPILNICTALRKLAAKYPDLQVVYPVHPNPNIKDIVYQQLSGLSNVKLCPPLDYLPLVHLMKRSRIVLTDSGGLQEEAPGLGKPVLVLREVTERPEGVAAGTVKLVGTNPDRILDEISHLLESTTAYEAMARARNPYGDGKAAERIVEALTQS